MDKLAFRDGYLDKESGLMSEILGSITTAFNPYTSIGALGGLGASAFTKGRTEAEQQEANKEVFKNFIPGRAHYNLMKRLGAWRRRRQDKSPRLGPGSGLDLPAWDPSKIKERATTSGTEMARRNRQKIMEFLNSRSGQEVAPGITKFDSPVKMNFSTAEAKQQFMDALNSGKRTASRGVRDAKHGLRGLANKAQDTAEDFIT